MLKQILASSVLILAFHGCQAVEEESAVKWGHLTMQEANGYGAWLVRVLPGEEIELCGELQTETKEAILKWAEPLGRAKHFKFAECDKGTKTRVKVTTKTNVYDQYCQGGTQAYTYGQGKNGYVSICGGTRFPMANLLVHEVGHLWGMCDQYAGHQNCDPNNTVNVDNNTIMGNGILSSSSTLTANDIEGIKKMADRPELADVKKTWADFLATQTDGTQTSEHSIFLGIPDMLDNEAGVNFWLSTSKGVSSVAICRGDKATCITEVEVKVDQVTWETRTNNNNDRLFFRSVEYLAIDAYVGKVTLIGFDGNNKVMVAREVSVSKR